MIAARTGASLDLRPVEPPWPVDSAAMAAMSSGTVDLYDPPDARRCRCCLLKREVPRRLHRAPHRRVAPAVPIASDFQSAGSWSPLGDSPVLCHEVETLHSDVDL